MTDPSISEPGEERLQEIASRFSYPRTPDLSRAAVAGLSSRRPTFRAWQVALLALLLAVAAMLAIPQVRALLSGYFRIGPITIFPFRPTPTATPTAATETATVGHPTDTPTPEPGPAALRGLEGRTTLKDALDRAPFPVMLPAYPADLGPPDYVYYQVEVPMVILSWSDPTDPDRLQLSLYAIDSNSPMINKHEPTVVQETTVNGQYALWAEGPYLLELSNHDFVLRRLVAGNTLIWQVNQVTYRLESGLPMEEAIKIAESLRTVEP
jgi:uncharacterized protein DUF4367